MSRGMLKHETLAQLLAEYKRLRAIIVSPSVSDHVYAIARSDAEIIALELSIRYNHES